MSQTAQAKPKNPIAPGANPKNISSLSQRLAALIEGGFGTHRGLIRMLLGETEFLAGRINQFLQPDLSATDRLVFVCLGNINRSAFAEGVLTPCPHG